MVFCKINIISKRNLIDYLNVVQEFRVFCQASFPMVYDELANAEAATIVAKTNYSLQMQAQLRGECRAKGWF